MIWGAIIEGWKGPYIFQGKEQGTINTEKYISYILDHIEPIFDQNHQYQLIQDNEPYYKAQITKEALFVKGIDVVKQPLYSLDLNIIEHVWSQMKNYIQQHYWRSRYNISRIPLVELRRIILEAWFSVPDSFIQELFNSFPRRCQAVIDAQGDLLNTRVLFSPEIDHLISQ